MCVCVLCGRCERNVFPQVSAIRAQPGTGKSAVMRQCSARPRLSMISDCFRRSSLFLCEALSRQWRRRPPNCLGSMTTFACKAGHHGCCGASSDYHNYAHARVRFVVQGLPLNLRCGNAIHKAHPSVCKKRLHLLFS